MPDPTLTDTSDPVPALAARYGRDVVDRAHESIVTDAPDLDGAAYAAALAAACADLAAIDRSADLADGRPTMATVARFLGAAADAVATMEPTS